MPQMYFHVKWPDEKVEHCYSPSSVIKSYFETGKTYALNEFMQRAESALNEASERVNAKYGYHCSSAMDQLSSLKIKAKQFDDHQSPEVTVMNITDKLTQ